MRSSSRLCWRYLFRNIRGRGFRHPDWFDGPDADVVAQGCCLSEMAAKPAIMVSASEEESEDPHRQTSLCNRRLNARCGQYVLPMRPGGRSGRKECPKPAQADNPRSNPRTMATGFWSTNTSILFSDPKRWDVVVFKFPGDAKVNYIKRLVGLPARKAPDLSGRRFYRQRKTPPKVKDYEIGPQAAEKGTCDAAAGARHKIYDLGRIRCRWLRCDAMALVARRRSECMESRKDDVRKKRVATIQRRSGRVDCRFVVAVRGTLCQPMRLWQGGH